MPRSDRGALLAAVLLGVMLLLGIVSGVALERWVISPERPEVAMRRGPGMPGRGMDPAAVRGRFSRQLARELDLDSAQARAVDSLLRQQQARVRAAVRESQPRLREITRETETGIRAVLSTEQWNRWQELRRERTSRRRPAP